MIYTYHVTGSKEGRLELTLNIKWHKALPYMAKEKSTLAY